jgi:hypothetical protein
MLARAKAAIECMVHARALAAWQPSAPLSSPRHMAHLSLTCDVASDMADEMELDDDDTVSVLDVCERSGK